jgi:hypothetical protein
MRVSVNTVAQEWAPEETKKRRLPPSAIADGLSWSKNTFNDAIIFGAYGLVLAFAWPTISRTKHRNVVYTTHL